METYQYIILAVISPFVVMFVGYILMVLAAWIYEITQKYIVQYIMFNIFLIGLLLIMLFS